MCEEQSQPTIPTALPTPSLTPTPPSRSNSNEGRQNSDNESVTERSQKYQDQKMTVPDSTVRQFNPVWSKPSQPQGYLQSHHYQPSRPAHGTDAPPSPISAPATPVTVSSASSMHGNPINRPIARQIKLSAPIMPGPLQESSFTRDISLVMEECMMGHGSTSVMKRTGNWQHRVGCMLCGGFGNESGETSPDGQAAAGKLWLWMCSWCALRVCGGCRYRLGEEEEKIRTRRGRGNSLTVKVDLQALRSKILEKARMVEKPDTKFPYESGISNIMENVLDVQASEIQTVAAVAPKRTDVTSRVDLEKKEAQQYIRKETVTMLSKKEIERTGESAVETSAESVNDKANIPHSRTLSSAITAPVPVTSVGNNQTSSVVPTDKSIDPFATAESTSQTEIFGRGVDVSRVMPPRAVKHPSRTPSMTQSQKFETEAAQGRLEASTSTLIAAPKSTGLPTGAESSQDSKSTIVPSASKTSPTTIATISTTTVPPHVVASPNSPASVARKSVPSESVTEASETLQALISGLPIVYTTNAPGTSLSPPPRIDSLPQPKQQQEKQVSSNSSQLLSKATSTPAPPPPMTPSSPVVPLVLATSLPSPATPTVHPPASPPQHTVKRKPVAPNMQGAYTESDKFAFPPLSFDSELAYEVDNLFENRSCTAPVQTTLVEEQPMIPDGKAAKVKKAKKWYRGLFK
ncbi:hypothetical protein BDZ91DRAFT_54498 [Kalaharituber pfeilii]|nr:hypothetical protein BDZ91DRAFT_54498 [Kalaharituber pfeilii]